MIIGRSKNEPIIAPPKIAKIAPFQPQNAPIQPNNLTSLHLVLPVRIYRVPLPRSSTISKIQSAFLQENDRKLQIERRMRLHQRIEWKDINKKGKRPSRAPPIVKRSGIVIVSESMITTFINIKPKDIRIWSETNRWKKNPRKTTSRIILL